MVGGRKTIGSISTRGMLGTRKRTSKNNWLELKWRGGKKANLPPLISKRRYSEIHSRAGGGEEVGKGPEARVASGKEANEKSKRYENERRETRVTGVGTN